MSNPSQTSHAEDVFASFFTQAEESPRYWAELAKLEFTEKVITRMKELGLSRSALAAKLEVQPGLVTRLLSGQNNFELATMTKIARALDCDFRCHLQPKGTETLWINVLKEEPERATAFNGWSSDSYRRIIHHDFSRSLPHENLPAAA
jgi:transcriptional regulator with XRE-family HTH domain